MDILEKKIKKNTNDFLSRLKIGIYFYNNYPLESILLLLSLIFAGILETIGILGVLPILEITMNDESSSSIQVALRQFFNFFNLKFNIQTLLIFILLIFYVRAILQIIIMRYVSYKTSRLAYDFRNKLIKNISLAKINFFNDIPTGKFVNALLIDGAKASTCFIAICRIIEISLRIVFLLIAAYFANFYILLFALLGTFILAFSLSYFLKIGSSTGLGVVRTQNNLSGILVDFLNNIKPLKAMNLSWKLNVFLKKESQMLYKLYALQLFAKNCIVILKDPLIVTFIVGGIYYAIETEIKFSEILILAAIFYRIANSYNFLQGNLQTLYINENFFNTFMALIDKAFQQKEKGSGTQKFKFSKEISYENISLHYNQKLIFEKLNLKIFKNKITSINGASGIGKTSIVDLLCCLISPSAGIIKIDEKTIDSIDINYLRDQIGYVSQDAFILNNTLRHNITLGDKKISDSEIWRVLELVNANEFIQKRKKSLNAELGEKGFNLSSGQKQRISLARVLLRNPSILILDEATNALDLENEKKFYMNLLKLKRKMTIIIINHNPKLLKFVDKVYTLKQFRKKVDII